MPVSQVCRTGILPVSQVCGTGILPVTQKGRERVRHKPGSVILLLKPAIGWQLSIWDVCYQTPLAVPLLNGTGKRPTLVPPTLLPTGVYRANASRPCWCALTAPLHPYPFQLSVISYQKIHCLLCTDCNEASLLTVKGGIFLWHYPHDRSYWELSSKFGLSGARTFLRLLSSP